MEFGATLPVSSHCVTDFESNIDVGGHMNAWGHIEACDSDSVWRDGLVRPPLFHRGL